MLDLLLVGLCVWLFFKGLGLAARMAWGAAKIAASVLFALALPMVLLCLVFAGGLLILVPMAMIAIACGLLKAVV